MSSRTITISGKSQPKTKKSNSTTRVASLKQNAEALSALRERSSTPRTPAQIKASVKNYFRNHAELARAIFVSNSDERELHFYVVLTKDNVETRDRVFDLQERFESNYVRGNPKLEFHFIPASTVPQLQNVTSLSA